ncbi:MAG: ABC transporter permease [Pseudonocardia sp.]|uniref:ABC transporter permease n=1 Tax=unclassified Pseudonocardia TaxID=2619320 RepID=UPI000A79107F|nr:MULTISPECIES: ABC transporter permease [unclassified Pseudonocardia]MBN9109589.1 ABC transporter permease [Pseudonocardia sp.]
MTTPTSAGGSPADADATGSAMVLPGPDAAAGGTAVPLGSRGSGQFADIRRRFVRNRLAMVGLAIVTVLIVLAIIGPYVTPYNAFEQNLANTLQPPSADHWFGTDVLGRDLFSGIVYGCRLAILVGLLTVAFSLLIGLTLGAVAGFKGGAWDGIIARFIDVFLAFPPLVGAIVIVRAVGGGVTPVIVALVALGWMTTARLTRGQVLALREAEYVEAARSIGADNRRIVMRHVLPNAIAPVLVYAFTNIGVVIVAMASLSYLGIGVPPDVPEWGRLISQATPFLRVEGKAHLWLAPALAIAITTLGFAFVADGMRDSLDPKLRGGN